MGKGTSLIRLLRFILVLALVLALDIASKFCIHIFLPPSIYETTYPYGGIGVFQGLLGGIDFSIIHVANQGGAWGILSSIPKSLLTVRIIVAFFLLMYLLLFQMPTRKQVPLTFILGGAVGNIIDFFIHGHVIDMFAFNFWGHPFAVFNVADSFICMGFVLLFIVPKKKTAAA